MGLQADVTFRTDDEAVYDLEVITASRRAEDDPGTAVWMDGMIAGLRWALGMDVVSPVRGVEVPATMREILFEGMTVVETAPTMEPDARRFAAGVERSLAWLRGRVDPLVAWKV